MTTLSEALHEALSTDPRGCEHPPYMKPQCERIAATLPAPTAPTTPRPLTAESEALLAFYTEEDGLPEGSWQREQVIKMLRAIEDAAHARAIAGVPGLDADIIGRLWSLSARWRAEERRVEDRIRSGDEDEGTHWGSGSTCADQLDALVLAALAATPPVEPVCGECRYDMEHPVHGGYAYHDGPTHPFTPAPTPPTSAAGREVCAECGEPATNLVHTLHGRLRTLSTHPFDPPPTSDR